MPKDDDGGLVAIGLLLLAGYGIYKTLERAAETKAKLPTSRSQSQPATGSYSYSSPSSSVDEREECPGCHRLEVLLWDDNMGRRACVSCGGGMGSDDCESCP